MPFRVAPILLLFFVLSCGARVSLGEDDESGADATAGVLYDSSQGPVTPDASVGDEPEDAADASFEDVEDPDGSDATLD